jgi:Alpha-kinase family
MAPFARLRRPESSKPKVAKAKSRTKLDDRGRGGPSVGEPIGLLRALSSPRYPRTHPQPDRIHSFGQPIHHGQAQPDGVKSGGDFGPRTSLISIQSGVHSRMRRVQHDVGKHDLQKAIKYGKKTMQVVKRPFRRPWRRGSRRQLPRPGNMVRWLIEYDGLVYVTDESMKREITVFPDRQKVCKVDEDTQNEHNEVRDRLRTQPNLCLVHTVLIVDNSGSMRIHDVSRHRDRQIAAYTELALEFVAERLRRRGQLSAQRAHRAPGVTSIEKHGILENEVVSLIEFSDSAYIVFEREPVSWVLYNMLLERRDYRPYRERLASMTEEWRRPCSNFLPAFEKALNVFCTNDHPSCHHRLVFLSDGDASDGGQQGWNSDQVVNRFSDFGRTVGSSYDSVISTGNSRLSAIIVGVGYTKHNESPRRRRRPQRFRGNGVRLNQDPFIVLRGMANVLSNALGMGTCVFLTLDRISHAFKDRFQRGQYLEPAAHPVTIGGLPSANMFGYGAAFSNSGGGTGLPQFGNFSNSARLTRRPLIAEHCSNRSWTICHILDRLVYHPRLKRLVRFMGLPFGARMVQEHCLEDEMSLNYLAVQQGHCGVGAERVAFRCRLTAGPHLSNLALGEMVAKEPLFMERLLDAETCHVNHCRAQSLAAYLADEFNHRIRGLPGYNPAETPQIKFLECCVLVLEDPTWVGGGPGLFRSVLVEKKLCTKDSGWVKWNNNGGGLAVSSRSHGSNRAPMGLLPAITEDMDAPNGGEIIDLTVDDDESDDGLEIIQVWNPNDGLLQPEEFLQAFSHFSYRFTERKMLVCDLQGVFSTSAVPPTFELTDPAIHSKGDWDGSRVNAFGRTDKGPDGMDMFFKSHKCSGLCKLLQLYKANSEWRADWENSSELDSDSRIRLMR